MRAGGLGSRSLGTGGLGAGSLGSRDLGTGGSCRPLACGSLLTGRLRPRLLSLLRLRLSLSLLRPRLSLLQPSLRPALRLPLPCPRLLRGLSRQLRIRALLIGAILIGHLTFAFPCRHAA